MQPKAAINDFVIKFANVNGTGSASAWLCRARTQHAARANSSRNPERRMN